MADTKPRVRVKAGARKSPPANARPTSRYLRPDRSGGILTQRQAVTRDAGHDVFEAADRANALANDFAQNSGWIAGAADQIIVDTIGEELKLNCRANLTALGYTEEQQAEWRKAVEKRFRSWSRNASECHLGGEMTFSEILDAVIRTWIVHGEAFGVLDYMNARERRKYGLTSGTKVSLISPHRLPRDTNPIERVTQGIRKDQNGRPASYRFLFNDNGIDRYVWISASRIVHAMDRGENPGSPRGISITAPVLKVAAQHDQLADATLATALLQTIFAATIKSPEPSEQAFDAIRSLDDMDPPQGVDPVEWEGMTATLKEDLFEQHVQRMESLKANGVSMNAGGQVNHLGPGEELDLHTASTPGTQYLPFSQNLIREIARRLGVTFEAMTMDHSNATYSSVRMAIASIWPIVQRRRSRIAAPFASRVYSAWLGEEIRSGRIELNGGHAAFLANEADIAAAEWQGPAKPSADDFKAAQAAEKRLEIGVSSLSDECAEYGRDDDAVRERITEDIKQAERDGVPHPYGRRQGGSGGPNGGAADGQREPARAT